MVQQTIDDTTLVEMLFEIFRNHGYEGTTIAQLSEATGLKKSSLYHRFPEGKADMAIAVVSYVSKQLTKHVIEPLLNNRVSPEQRINTMLIAVKSFYSAGSKNCLLNVLSLGNAKEEIKTLLNIGYNSWLKALTQLGLETGMSEQVAQSRSHHFLIVVEGALVIQRLTENSQTFTESLAYEQEQFFKGYDR